jgi:hypothetical protein
MADIHLSTTGSNTSPYDTWAKAATSWATAVAGMVAGDRLLADSSFNNSAAGLSISMPGTPSNPNKILSGTPAVTSGLSALAVGAKFLSSTSTCALSGSYYAYGLVVETVSNTSAAFCALVAGHTAILESCTFKNSVVNANMNYTFGSNAAGAATEVRLKNPIFRFGYSSQLVLINGVVNIQGGSLESGTAVVNKVFTIGNIRAGHLTVIGFDFTNAGAAADLVSQYMAGCVGLFSDIKLPTSWTGSYINGTLSPGSHVEFYCADNAATNYRFSINDYMGTAREDSAIYLTGSTTDGAAISDKIETTANVAYPMCFKSRWLYAYDAGAGSAKTATVQCARDGSATKYDNDEVWLEVECLGTTGTPLGVFSDGAMSDVLATPAALATGAGSWTGLGGTNCKMDLTASYTPRNAGYVRARVCMAVPSAILYYDPVVTLT